jgi:hypothetical protein
MVVFITVEVISELFLLIKKFGRAELLVFMTGQNEESLYQADMGTFTSRESGAILSDNP